MSNMALIPDEIENGSSRPRHSLGGTNPRACVHTHTADHTSEAGRVTGRGDHDFTGYGSRLATAAAAGAPGRRDLEWD